MRQLLRSVEASTEAVAEGNEGVFRLFLGAVQPLPDLGGDGVCLVVVPAAQGILHCLQLGIGHIGQGSAGLLPGSGIVQVGWGIGHRKQRDVVLILPQHGHHRRRDGSRGVVGGIYDLIVEDRFQEIAGQLHKTSLHGLGQFHLLNDAGLGPVRGVQIGHVRLIIGSGDLGRELPDGIVFTGPLQIQVGQIGHRPEILVKGQKLHGHTPKYCLL